MNTWENTEDLFKHVKIDKEWQCWVHMSEQTLVSGWDLPDDWPEHQNPNIFLSFYLNTPSSGGGAWPLLDHFLLRFIDNECSNLKWFFHVWNAHFSEIVWWLSGRTYWMVAFWLLMKFSTLAEVYYQVCGGVMHILHWLKCCRILVCLH